MENGIFFVTIVVFMLMITRFIYLFTNSCFILMKISINLINYYEPSKTYNWFTISITRNFKNVSNQQSGSQDDSLWCSCFNFFHASSCVTYVFRVVISCCSLQSRWRIIPYCLLYVGQIILLLYLAVFCS